MNWAIIVTTPLIAALIGFGSRLLAAGLMFLPREFAGLGPFGWQGVVPRHATRIAATAAEQLTALVDLREVFAAVDADRLRAEVEQPVLNAIDDIARDVLAEYHPGVWESLPPIVQELAVKQLQAAAPQIVRQLVDELRDNVDALVDLKGLAMQRLTADRARFTELVRELARPELRFAALTGAWSGFATGVLQAVVWALTEQPLVMPLFGFAVGLGASWLAVRLVFQPREPRRVLGRTVQGSFHRRRAAVARQYGELIAAEVLTPRALLDALLNGPGSGRARELVAAVVGEVVDEQTRGFQPLVSATIGTAHLEDMKRSAAARAMPALADVSRGADAYLADTMDVARMVEARICELTPAQYENLLRPAFTQQRWQLATAGGVLGAVVGSLQVLFLLG